MDHILTILPGFLLGTVSSIVAWATVYHGFSPRLKFSSKISKQAAEDEPGGWAYRVKFENAGRRAIVDLSVKAKLEIQGLNSKHPNNREVTYLPVSFDGQIQYVEPSKRKGRRCLIRIRVSKGDEFMRSIYPTELRSKAENNTLTLEDLLSTGSAATVQLIGLGFDSFSGTRKAFFSPVYTREDLVQRAFEPGSLALTPVCPGTPL